MSNPNQNQEEEINLVEKVSEYVSTDTITDVKSGIFNLFTMLYQQYSLEYGPVNALKMSIGYLNDIIDHFQSILEETDTNN
jgi:hypothetical protein